MPTRTLRFFPMCLTTQHAAVREQCRACGSALQPLLDENGVWSGAFLAARGTCCDHGCRNCPYDEGDLSVARGRQRRADQDL